MNKHINFRIMGPKEFAVYSAKLLALEAQVTYPYGDNSYLRFDHGDDYGRFSRGIGDPSYAVILDGSKLVGMLAFVRQTILFNNKPIKAIYYGDFKLDKAYRGSSIGPKFTKWFGRQQFLSPGSWKSRLHYAFGVHNTKGEVFSKNKYLSLFKPAATHTMYMTTRASVLSLPQFDGVERISKKSPLDLSPYTGPENAKSLSQIKDFRIGPEDKLMEVLHMQGCREFGNDFVTQLKSVAAKANKDTRINFALDTRRLELNKHLKANKITVFFESQIKQIPFVWPRLQHTVCFLDTCRL